MARKRLTTPIVFADKVATDFEIVQVRIDLIPAPPVMSIDVRHLNANGQEVLRQVITDEPPLPPFFNELQFETLLRSRGVIT